jgi:hypothetical protein
MAQVHQTSNPNKKWFILLALVAAGVVAVTWWVRGDHGLTSAVQPAAPASALATVPAPMAAASGPSADDPIVKAQTEALVSAQKVAAKVIEEQPVMKPIVGPVTERPPYVSVMEWAMLKGVTQQNPNPDKELTRMVNFLRFNKQMEAWEALPKSADAAAKRQVLAEQLLDDLPARLLNGEMDLAEVKRLQGVFLADAVPDAAERKHRAAKEAKRLVMPPPVAQGVPAAPATEVAPAANPVASTAN